MTAYVPRKGDFISIALDGRTGHEQRGHRPALVLSNDLFNERTGMALVCPVTNTRRGFPFHIEIPQGAGVTGVVMTEQVRSIDYRARRTKRLAAAPPEVVEQALALLDASLF